MADLKQRESFATLPHGQSRMPFSEKLSPFLEGGCKEFIMAKDSPHYISIFVQGITVYLDVLLQLSVCRVTYPGKPLLTD